MDPLIVILTIAVTVVTLVMTAAGIQLIITLREARKTFLKINTLADTAEGLAQHSFGALANLGGMLEGAKSGMKIAQSFISWLNREKEN